VAMVLNATFNNISIISWRLVLLVDETEILLKVALKHHKVQTCKTL
jgi:hypothetical protein